MNKINFPMRSLMFVPGNNIKFIKKSFNSDADVLLLDLEDSVESIKNKAIARNLILRLIKLNTTKKIFIRINDIESGEILKDLEKLTINGIDGFMFPKSLSGLDIYFIDKLITSFEYKKGLEVGKFKIIPIIETTSAVMNVDEICKSSKRVIAIAFGNEDYLTDLGALSDPNGVSLFFPRVMITNAAKANNIVPIDTVHVNVHDLKDLEQKLQLSKKLGFEGMLVLHPKELPLVNKYFSPSISEIKNAKNIIKISKSKLIKNKSVDIIDGKFVGPPMIKAAKKILERDKLIRGL
jgi:citrate lyase subunit beta/citryl-CoA lyase